MTKIQLLYTIIRTSDLFYNKVYSTHMNTLLNLTSTNQIKHAHTRKGFQCWGTWVSYLTMSKCNNPEIFVYSQNSKYVLLITVWDKFKLNKINKILNKLRANIDDNPHKFGLHKVDMLIENFKKATWIQRIPKKVGQSYEHAISHKKKSPILILTTDSLAGQTVSYGCVYCKYNFFPIWILVKFDNEGKVWMETILEISSHL